MTEPKYPWYKGPRGRDVHPPPPEPERERNAALFDAKQPIERGGPTVESQRAVLDKPFAAKRVEPASAVSKAETDSKDSPYIDPEVRRLQPKPYRVEMSGTPTVSALVDQRTGQRISGASGTREFNLHGKEKPLLPFIGEQFNSEAREKLSRPYWAADVHFSGPSVESTRAIQDKPVTAQQVSRQPQSPPEEAVEKASPRVGSGEATIPPPAPPRPNSLSEEEAKPKYEPGWHPNTQLGSYVIPFSEYSNTRPRRAPERKPSLGSEPTAEGDNVDVPVDTGGATP